VMLYKTPPSAPNRWDVIALFVQPVDPALSIAHPFMLVIDETSTDAQLIAFQQMIFLQDKIVLENQRPSLLPLQPGKETPTRADLSSVLYRRWLKEKGLVYGTEPRTDLVDA
jgi:phenylpropionate dioxygenase-like ring-hydroxylating dioxygenase large terminal subunit